MATNAIENAAPVWPSFIREEFEANQNNGQVGTRLLSETDRVRVRHMLWRRAVDRAAPANSEVSP
jgi:hypothetical protein